MGEQEKREKTMHYSILDGAAWSLMMHTAQTFLIPFAIAINLPLFFISALSSFPQLFDGIAQKIGSYSTDFNWNRKKILVYGAILQALMLLGLAIVVFHSNTLCSDFKNTLIMLLVTAIFFFGGIINPSWCGIIGDVVPEQIRASWFGKRAKIIQIVALLTLFFSGIFLDYMKTDVIMGFIILFLIAAMARVISAYYLNLHWDPNPEIKSESEVNTDFTKYCICLFFIYFSFFIANTYIIVYKLKLLNFDYFWFSLGLIAFTLSYALSAPHWGRLIEKYGTKKILSATFMLSFIAIILWIFITTPVEAIPLELFRGMLWSGIMLSSINYLYEITSARTRIKAMGQSALFIGAGSFAGTIAGGAILEFLGDNTFFSFYILFLIIALIRVVSSFFVAANIKELKIPLKKITTLRLMAKIITVYPFQGLAYDLNSVWKNSKRLKIY